MMLFCEKLTVKVIGFMDGFAKFIGKFPFNGKMEITPVILSVYYSRTIRERSATYKIALKCLLKNVFIHLTRASAGLVLLVFVETPLWANLINFFYLFMNLNVMLTQAFLVYRVRHFVFKKKKSFLSKKLKHHPREYSDTEKSQMNFVTRGGQLIFFIQGLYFSFQYFYSWWIS